MVDFLRLAPVHALAKISATSTPNAAASLPAVLVFTSLPSFIRFAVKLEVCAAFNASPTVKHFRAHANRIFSKSNFIFSPLSIFNICFAYAKLYFALLRILSNMFLHVNINFAFFCFMLNIILLLFLSVL